jgi:hypothetical protein
MTNNLNKDSLTYNEGVYMNARFSASNFQDPECHVTEVVAILQLEVAGVRICGFLRAKIILYTILQSSFNLT